MTYPCVEHSSAGASGILVYNIDSSDPTQISIVLPSGTSRGAIISAPDGATLLQLYNSGAAVTAARAYVSDQQLQEVPGSVPGSVPVS